MQFNTVPGHNTPTTNSQITNTQTTNTQINKSQIKNTQINNAKLEGEIILAQAGFEKDPVVKFVNEILLDAIQMGASDLHFEPYEKFFRVRSRIDGVMREVARQPLPMVAKILSRLKIMAQIDISERRIPQDGRVKLKLSNDHSIDFRVNTLPTLFGEKIVLRIINSAASLVGIDHLGLELHQKQLFLEALHQPQGMILITGPTGSGKTVSLYTGLHILNTDRLNISTVEDPVEINLAGVNQVNVNNKVGLTFDVALKAFLRQDPDVVMVGEIRDIETADIAIKASQTGHLVLSTLHTNSATETLTRLHHMGVPQFNIANSISLVVAQRLVRCLCHSCKQSSSLSKTYLLSIGFTASELDASATIYEPVGCSECNEGYKGRVAIFEVMKIDENMTKVIMEGGNPLDIKKAAQKMGFYDLRHSAKLKVLEGITSIQEMFRVTAD